jgi:hypothetical protein
VQRCQIVIWNTSHTIYLPYKVKTTEHSDGHNRVKIIELLAIVILTNFFKPKMLKKL